MRLGVVLGFGLCAAAVEGADSDVLQRARAWYAGQIDIATAACVTATTAVDTARERVRRNQDLQARAAHEPAAAQVAAQAAAKSRAILERRQSRAGRECGMKARLQAALESFDPRYAASAAPYFSRGSVTVLGADGKPLPASRTTLRPGDRIKTGADGEAELVFPDGSRALVGADSEFTFEPDAALLKRGRLHSVHEFLRRPEMPSGAAPGATRARIQVGGPAIVVAVRGTEYSIRLDAEGRGAIVLLDGALAVTAGRDREYILGPGQQLGFSGGQVVGGPVSLEASAIERWWE